EIVALDHNGVPDFVALQAALSEGNADQLVFFAFDLLFIGQETMLAKRQKKDPLIRYVEHFATAGDAVLRSACRMSLEGIVSKQLDAPYTSGRGGAWTKAKCRAGHEVVIGGWSETNGRFR